MNFQIFVSDEDWAVAYEALVEDNQINWRIKKGWNKGQGLAEKIKKLSLLQTINCSGNIESVNC